MKRKMILTITVVVILFLSAGLYAEGAKFSLFGRSGVVFQNGAPNKSEHLWIMEMIEEEEPGSYGVSVLSTPTGFFRIDPYLKRSGNVGSLLFGVSVDRFKEQIGYYVIVGVNNVTLEDRDSETGKKGTTIDIKSYFGIGPNFPGYVEGFVSAPLGSYGKWRFSYKTLCDYYWEGQNIRGFTGPDVTRKLSKNLLIYAQYKRCFNSEEASVDQGLVNAIFIY